MPISVAAKEFPRAVLEPPGACAILRVADDPPSATNQIRDLGVSRQFERGLPTSARGVIPQTGSSCLDPAFGHLGIVDLTRARFATC